MLNIIEKAMRITWVEKINQITIGKTESLIFENVQSLIRLLPSEYDENAKFLMSKQTFYNYFMTLEDNSKNLIVKVRNGNNYLICGYPVLLDENVAVGEVYFGCEISDSEVEDANAFVRLVKAAV